MKKSRQVLADGQFTDRSSVAACEEKARSLYDSFCTAERECKKRSRKLLAGAGMLLAVCGALLAGYLGITDLSRFLPFVIAGGGGAIMGLVLAMVLTARGKRFDRKWKRPGRSFRSFWPGIWETEPYPRRPWMRFMAVWQSFQSFVICWTSLSMRWINIQKISALSRRNRITAAR